MRQFTASICFATRASSLKPSLLCPSTLHTSRAGRASEEGQCGSMLTLSSLNWLLRSAISSAEEDSAFFLLDSRERRQAASVSNPEPRRGRVGRVATGRTQAGRSSCRAADAQTFEPSSRLPQAPSRGGAESISPECVLVSEGLIVVVERVTHKFLRKLVLSERDVGIRSLGRLPLPLEGGGGLGGHVLDVEVGVHGKGRG